MNNSFKDYINYQLIKRGYFNFDEVKSEDLITVIEDYFFNELEIEKNESDIFTLFTMYKEQASEESVMEIINYLINSLSIMQGGRIEWWLFGKNKEPKLSYDIETNKIVSINTSTDIDYQKIFVLLMNTLIDLKVSREEERKR
mgnify:FL=1